MISCSKANAKMTFFGARQIYSGTFLCLMPYYFFLLCQAMNDADFALMCPEVAVTLCASGKLGPRSLAKTH